MRPFCRRGLTVVELTMGAAVAALVCWSAYQMLHAETRMTRNVQQRADVAQEARLILDQLREDLQLSCQPLSGGKFRPGLNDTLEHGCSDQGETWSFLSFTRDMPLEEAVSIRRFGKSFRQASRVTWRLVPLPKGGSGRGRALERVTENPASGAAVVRGAESVKRLSERVLAFDIRPQTIWGNGEQMQVFRVSLRLRLSDQTSTDAGCDLFEVVCPSFFQSTWSQHGIRHPWHVVIVGP